MGGNALKHLISTERIPHNDFIQLREEIVNTIYDKIMPIYTDKPLIIRGMNFLYKEDYGDLDFIICIENGERDYVVSLIKDALGSQYSVNNGHTTTIDYKGKYQLDLSFCYSLEDFYWRNSWYSYGDTAASIGRISKLYRLKFREDGLYYQQSSKFYNKKKHDVFVTKNMDDALYLLGYNNTTWLSNIYSCSKYGKMIEDNLNDIIKTDLICPAVLLGKPQRNSRIFQKYFDDKMVDIFTHVDNVYPFNGMNRYQSMAKKHTILYLINKMRYVTKYLKPNHHFSFERDKLNRNIMNALLSQFRTSFYENLIYPWYNPIRRMYKKLVWKMKNGN